MKCICGYEHETEWNSKQRYNETIKGDEKFTEIKGTFLVKTEYDYSAPDIRQISLYACPKCGTVRINT